MPAVATVGRREVGNEDREGQVIFGLNPDDLAALDALAARPKCENKLNGSCSVCGPSLDLEGAFAWQRELEGLGIPPSPD